MLADALTRVGAAYDRRKSMSENSYDCSSFVLALRSVDTRAWLRFFQTLRRQVFAKLMVDTR